ncbi:sugar ABC transporter ATP-binding protein [Comamonas sp. GB3 AK4-5]|uniref:sugar ABC transporter ATP-binding protein n=1 Tax=Comamonas sp. GB3 AK4-5 TaxID=3231487 RepID=UPI00351F4426
MNAAPSLGVEFVDVVKAFGAVRVLRGVSFVLDAGRVHGLLGENGAGKSTLMKILAGYEAATSGSVLVNGQAQRFASSRDAEALGIVLIHQEFNLADDLSIAQNIFLGHELKRGWLLDEAVMERAAADALAQIGLQLSPKTRVGDLQVAEKQMVEIAKALSRRVRLLILDEPTASLTPNEAQRLFQLIERLRADGVTMVYISHKLQEIERITDDVIVMRDGCLVARAPTCALTRAQMAHLMVGRELADLYPPRNVIPDDAPVMLSVRDFTVLGRVLEAGFAVRAGEVLGFAGLVGAGRTELFEGLLGLRPAHGEVVMQGKRLLHGKGWRNPREAVQSGLGYLSEDRKGKGLHLELGLSQNLTLMALQQHARPWLQPASEKAALEEAINQYGIRSRSLDVKAGALSGGNQQKLALAKVLQPCPKVVVLDEPTRGVDVGAKRDIYFLIHELACAGLAVIVISSELVELIGLCHRVVVMRAGRCAATLDAHHLTEEELIGHATGTVADPDTGCASSRDKHPQQPDPSCPPVA